MKNSQFYVLIMLFLVILPGCGRLVDWGKNTFYQGHDLVNNADKARRDIRSLRLYDQFTTAAIFDVIWLSDEVRQAYTGLYATRMGLKAEHAKAFLRRQYEENNHFISFYVLSLYEISLGAEMSEWTVFITINGENYYPMEVKAVDLPQEYKLFFDKRFTRFKTSYIITFDAKDINGDLLLQDACELVMNFKSAFKEGCVSWYVDELTMRCVGSRANSCCDTYRQGEA